MKNNKIFSCIIIGIYILTLLAISNNLRTPYLWFDEAGQFFISKGLNHDSNPLETEKGLPYVIENNAFYNMDPGGFSILLHFWSKISNSHIWLRFLPSLFFIGVVLSFIYLSHIWSQNLSIALVLGFIPILYPMILRMGFEVRAYSMETVGAVLCVVALGRLSIKLNFKNIFLWSCIFSIFMTSRYSLIIVVFVTSTYIVYLIYTTNKTLKTKVLLALSYAFPLIISLVCIYFFALVYQNPNITALSYLPYLSNNPLLLLSPFNCLYISSIGFCSLLLIAKNKYQIINKYKSLLYIAVTVNVFFIILSFLGKHPWSPSSTRCISMVVLMLLCFSSLLGELLKALFNSSEVIKYCFLLSVLILTLYLRKESLFIRQDYNNTYCNIVKTDIVDYERIYVDRWESPCVRYLFEYGKLKSKKKGLYPDKFTFAKFLRHGFYVGKLSKADFYKTQPTMNELLDYDLLITPELFDRGYNDKWSLINGTTNFYVQINNQQENQSNE
ncbi:MAG: hypothetical protein ACYSWQ_20900 [Planctomycetota bacterium]|jgi:hypothetical protein